MIDGRDLDDAFLAAQDDVADLEFRALVVGGEAVPVDGIVGGEGQGDVGEGVDAGSRRPPGKDGPPAYKGRRGR